MFKRILPVKSAFAQKYADRAKVTKYYIFTCINTYVNSTYSAVYLQLKHF